MRKNDLEDDGNRVSPGRLVNFREEDRKIELNLAPMDPETCEHRNTYGGAVRLPHFVCGAATVDSMFMETTTARNKNPSEDARNASISKGTEREGHTCRVGAASSEVVLDAAR